jgi:hypothetical protein
MATLTITIKGDDQASDKVEKLAKAFAQLEQGAKRAGEGLDKAAAQTGKLSKAAQAVDGAGRQARIGLGAAAQAAEQLGVNIGGVVGPAAGAADAIGDMAGAGAAADAIGIAVGALVIGIGLAAAAIDKYNQSQAATVMQTDAVIQSMHGLITTNKAAAAAAQEYALAQAQAITYAQKGLSTNLGDYAQSAADAVLALDKATNGVMRFIPQWQQQVMGARALGEAVESSAEKADKLRAALVNLPFNEMRDALNQLTAQNPFERLAQSAGLSADKLKEMASASVTVRNSLNDLISVEQTLAMLQAQRAELQRQLADAQMAGDTAKMAELTAKLDENTAAMERVKAKADEIRAALDEQTAAIEGNTRRWEALNGVLLRYAETSSQASLTANRWAQYNRAIAASLDMTESQMEKGGTTLEQYNANLKKLAEDGAAKAKAALTQLRQTIRSLVEQALQPTAVTMEDLNAAMAGKYIPKWDEFRRRVEAVASGSDIEQFGPKFKAQLEMVQSMFQNLNLEQIAAKFKDFSLFADLNVDQIKQLIDFGPIEAQVSQQIDSIIGKAKAMQVAFDEVWSSLSTQKKIDLAQALNIDVTKVDINSAQVQDQIQKAISGVGGGGGAGQTQVAATVQTKLAFDHAASDREAAAAQAKILAIPASKAGETVKTLLNVDHAAADAAVSALTSAIAGIPASKDGETVTTIVDVVKAATFDDNLKAILDDIAKIPTEIDVHVNMVSGGGTEGGGTEGGGGTPPVGQQHGGAGVLARDTLFYAHAGEGYWFSGVPWRVPPPRSGDARFGPPVITIGTVVVRDPEDAKKLAREIIAEWEEQLMRSGRALERH